MKRIFQLVAVAALVLVPLAVSPPASAAFKCEVGYTGPDSQNRCTSEEKFECTIQNTNEVTIKNSTNQTVASGNVTVDGNGTGGGAVSGSASNNNNATFNVVVDNGNKNQPCVVTASVPATETPEQPAPGKGESTTPVQPTQKVTPAALPVTSGNTAPTIFLVGGLVVLTALAVAYRRLF